MIFTFVHKQQNKIEKDLQAWIIFFIMGNLYASTMMMKWIISLIWFLSFTSNRKYESVFKTQLPEIICQRLAAFWSFAKFFFFKLPSSIFVGHFSMLKILVIHLARLSINFTLRQHVRKRFFSRCTYRIMKNKTSGLCKHSLWKSILYIDYDVNKWFSFL